MSDPTPGPDAAPAYRDRLPNPVTPEGEREIMVLAADPARYRRDYMTIGLWGLVIVSAVLIVLGRAAQLWAGVLGVIAALGFRGLWLYSDHMAVRWIVTDRAVIGPGGQRVELADIAGLRRLMGDVQITTKGGRKVLIKHLADPQAVINKIKALQ